eukprot:scaffold9114_cov118-Isochrysis_galbana.AAC.18
MTSGVCGSPATKGGAGGAGSDYANDWLSPSNCRRASRCNPFYMTQPARTSSSSSIFAAAAGRHAHPALRRISPG